MDDPFPLRQMVREAHLQSISSDPPGNKSVHRNLKQTLDGHESICFPQIAIVRRVTEEDVELFSRRSPRIAARQFALG
jgi:hypothetical protein